MYLKNIKAAKRSSVFVLAIFVCWLPYALWLVSDTITSKKWTSFDHEVYILLLMFGLLNSALNPFLFVFRKKNFRAVYAKRFSSLKHRSHLSIQDSNVTELARFNTILKQCSFNLNFLVIAVRFLSRANVDKELRRPLSKLKSEGSLRLDVSKQRKKYYMRKIQLFKFILKGVLQGTADEQMQNSPQPKSFLMKCRMRGYRPSSLSARPLCFQIVNFLPS